MASVNHDGDADKEVKLNSPDKEVKDEKKTGDMAREEGVLAGNGAAPNDFAQGGGEDLLDVRDLDPALSQKMHLVNNVRMRSVRPLE